MQTEFLDTWRRKQDGFSRAPNPRTSGPATRSRPRDDHPRERQSWDRGRATAPTGRLTAFEGAVADVWDDWRSYLTCTIVSARTQVSSGGQAVRVRRHLFLTR